MTTIGRYPEQSSVAARAYVHRGGFVMRRLAQRWVILGVTLAVCVAFAVAYASLPAEDRAEILATVAVVAVALFGYWQWREGRHEAAIDQFYDRMHWANEIVVDSFRVGLARSERVIEILDRACVYAELDNLEYSLEKYRLGYMRPELAARALRTFQDRCKRGKTSVSDDHFCTEVRRIIGVARCVEEDFSYNDLTLRVAEWALEDARRPGGPDLGVRLTPLEWCRYFLDAVPRATRPTADRAC
jgi:hypothetical protein